MAEVFSSVFKGKVHVTTPFSASHKAIDLGNYKTKNKTYSANFLGTGKVSTIYKSYSYKGVLYKNSLVLWTQYDNGYKTALYHGDPKDQVVRVGDKVVPGQLIYVTGNTGYSKGDHLHFELWKDGKQVDPTKLILNDEIKTLKIGTRLQFSGDMNLRDSNGKIIGTIKKGAVGEIFKVREFDGTYQWYKIQFLDIKGVVADTNLNKITTKAMTNLDGSVPVVVVPPVEPPQPPQPTECENEINRLKGLIERLETTTGAQKAELEQRKLEYAQLQKKYDTLYVERNRFENEKNELMLMLSAGLTEVRTGELIAEIWRRILSLK